MGKAMKKHLETFDDFFKNGMGRDPGFYDLYVASESAAQGQHINLGAGDSPVPHAQNLDLPDWDANREPIPYAAGSVAGVHAYHFLEHLDPAVMLKVMRDVERVLYAGGVFNIVVPYGRSDIAFQDPTHRTFFTEETWRTILDNGYYKMGGKRDWKLRVNFNLIAGVAGRNLAIFTQLVKEA